MLFEKPLLKSNTVTVGDQPVILYEFTADLYYDHILEAGWIQHVAEGKSAADIEPESEIDYEKLLHNRRIDKDRKIVWVACALKPGYPDKTVDQLIASLKAELNGQHLETLFIEVNKLNAPSDPKPEASPESDSSTG